MSPSIYRRSTVHYAFSREGGWAACGLTGVQYRGVGWTTRVERTTCGNCLRYLRSHPPKEVAP